MGTFKPAQMYDHNIAAVKAAGDPMHRLDFTASVTGSEGIHEGSLCSVNVSGAMIAGLGSATNVNKPMPMFALANVTDFDVNSDYGNTSGGVISAAVATGGYEIATTEFVSGTYHVNDMLTAATGDDAGKVKKATVDAYGAEPIVGIVSKSVAKSPEGTNMLTFWTCFVPSRVDAFTDTSPTASATVAGLIKVGGGLSITDGVLSVAAATDSVIGGAKVGAGLAITDGVLSVAAATETTIGGVKVGAGLDVTADGTLSVGT